MLSFTPLSAAAQSDTGGDAPAEAIGAGVDSPRRQSEDRSATNFDSAAMSLTDVWELGTIGRMWWNQSGRFLSAGSGQSAGTGPASAMSVRASASANGIYFMADGSRTDDLESAAASWRADPEFAVDPAKAQIKAEYAYALGLTGRGIKLGELDSGVDDNVDAIGSRLHLLNTRDAIELPNPLYSPLEAGNFDGRTLIGYSGENWHGTHVASSIAASRNGRGTFGVAFESDLYSATHYLAGDGFVLARGTQYDAGEAGLRALADQSTRAINNSWGSTAKLTNGTVVPSNYDPAVFAEYLKGAYAGAYAERRDAFRYAVDRDVVMIFAAGNSSTAQLRAHAGIEASAPMALPELESHWLSVTSVASNNVISSFASECGGTKYWCIAAPGELIASESAVRKITENDIDNYLAAMGWTRENALTKYSAAYSAGIAKLRLTGDASDLARATFGGMVALSAADPAFMQSLRTVEGSPYEAQLTDRDIMDLLLNNLVYPSIRLQATLYATRNKWDIKNAYSSYEATLVALFSQYSQIEQGTYLSSGTSMASPHVTGSLGLVMERFGYLTNSQARDVLLTTATDLGAAGVDGVYGWGLVDVQKAMNGPGALLGDWDVTMADGVTDNWSNDIANGSVYTGRADDHGALIKRGGGSLTLSGSNSFDGVTVVGGTLGLTGGNIFSGNALVSGGLFEVSGSLDAAELRVTGGQLNLGGTLQSTPLLITGGGAVVTASGRLENSDLVVGNTTADSGSIVFNGTQTGGTTLVAAGGRLGGVGTLGSTRVEGTIAPGQSIGTLTIVGDYVQARGSTYEVELTPPSSVDRIVVNGQARIEGGTVVLTRAPGVYNLGQSYGFLSATGGVTGMFEAINDAGLSPFIRVGLNYLASSITLDVERGAALASVAGTANQMSVAGAADALSDASPLLQRLVQLFPNEAVTAFDQLGGEIHADALSGMRAQARYARETALARTIGSPWQDRAGFGKAAIWMEALTGNGQMDSNGNASELRTGGHGLLIGADYTTAGGLRIGGFAGGGKADFAVRSLASTAKGDALHIGIYAGKNWGALGVRGGATVSNYDLKSRRTVAFTGLNETLAGQYDGSSRQIFGEVGYILGSVDASVEPFARYVRVHTNADGFGETGGTAALTVAKRSTDTDLASIGLRFDIGLSPPAKADRLSVRFRGSISGQRASGDRGPVASASFAGGAPFQVGGTVLPKTAGNVQAGLAVAINRRALIELGYSGQFGDGGDDHGFSARISLRF